ncbi:hypothetical protein Moror_16847 [Moniliophthora roreri MCA 2997]|uniref:Transmembrane protein n=2 Tax=Moniliophthora roreri TaxID=221103 RepID=V2YDI6_MONRO|nr:hypothetical protein Moror_16847 [Moniliophthora roreri MCA 2997]KAI3599194.1 hypothetical protein WG66_013402 [Moniliophthora roreri]
MAEKSRPYHILTSVVHLLGISVLSYLISRRTPSFRQKEEWKDWAWGRICMLLVLIDIWFFLLVSAILLLGVGATWDPDVCEAVIVTCIFFQGSSKVLIAAYLVEKMYIVWTKAPRKPRLRSKTYQVGSLLIIGYIAVNILAFLGRKSSIRSDGECVLAYKPYTTIILMAYEGFQDLSYTFMFIWPLRRSYVISPRLREIARRSLYGALGGLAISLATAVVVMKVGNSGVGWICMNACMIDATLNALLLYWVGSGVSSDSEKQFSLPEIPVTTKATTAITSTIRFMGPTYSNQTASTASQVDPEKGYTAAVAVPDLTRQPQNLDHKGAERAYRSRRHSL